MLTDTAHELAIDTLNICRQVEIAAPIDVVFETLLQQLGPDAHMPDGRPFPLKLEPWPGGRWYRDLGNNSGHLWGHVQVIKPPTLLEIAGPLCVSYAAINHVQYRLTEQGRGTRLALTHRALGDLAPEHRDGMSEGWGHGLEEIRKVAERRSGGTRSRAPR